MAKKYFISLLLICVLIFIITPGTFAFENTELISDDNPLEDWIKIQNDIYLNSNISNTEIPIYDQLADAYYQLYLDTGKLLYINYALNEAGRNKRNSIIDRLSHQELDSLSIIIDKLENRTISSEYFDLREFTEQDLYAFLRLPPIPDLNNEAYKLLNYWHENLEDKLEENYLLGSFKAQALVTGYYRLNEFEKVYEVGKKLISNHPFPESTFTIDLFNFVAFSSSVNGYYKDALDVYREELLSMTENVGSADQYLRTRLDYANILFRIGNVSAAKDQYEYVHTQDHEITDTRYRSALFNNLAISYLNSGNFEQFVEFQLNAYDMANEQDNYTQQLAILRNLFNFYRRQGESSTASNYINQALQLASDRELFEELASLLIPYGIHLRESERNYEQSESELLEALRLSANSNNYRNLYNSHLQLALTYQEMNRYDSALEHFNQACELSNAREDDPGYIEAKIWIANLHMDIREFKSAAEAIEPFSDNDYHKLTFEKRVLANNINLKLLQNRGEINRALEKSGRMISEIIAWLRESSDQQTGHMRMDDQFSEAFRIHTNLMYKTNQYEAALATIGELRDISRSGFYNNPLLKSKVLSDEELIYDYALGNRIQRLRNNISQATEQERVSLNNELLTAISERNQLLNRALPRVENQQFEEQLTEVQKNMDNDQAIFFFSIFEDQIFRFLITRSEVNMRVFPQERGFMNLLRKATATLGRERTNLEDLHNIYTTFFEADMPASINHIYMVPDDDFYRLPIEILPVEPVSSPFSYGSATYLLEKYSVSYANSLSDLIRDDDSSTSFEYDIAGFGIRNFMEAGHDNLADLPFSPQEIRQSVDRLDQFSKRTFFLDHESTRENFIKTAGNTRILHVATHSKVNDENPLFSSLYLYTGSNLQNGNSSTENAGILHAYELFELNMNAELVFLSSCESGSGGFLKGAGVLGFSRALSYAGAKSLLINLWPVRDQTAASVSHSFYDEINKGANKAEALRTARLSYLNTTNSDPYLWGSFVLYGDISSPLTDKRHTRIVVLLSLLIIGLIAFGLITYRKSVEKNGQG